MYDVLLFFSLRNKENYVAQSNQIVTFQSTALVIQET